MTFGDRLRELRLDKNLTQNQLSIKLRLGQSRISQWELDRIQPNLEQLKVLCEILDIQADYLLGISEIDGVIHSDKRMNLTEEEEHLLDNWRQIPKDSQETYIVLMDREVSREKEHKKQQDKIKQAQKPKWA